jgi:hypothetical protein
MIQCPFCSETGRGHTWLVEHIFKVHKQMCRWVGWGS